MISYDQNIDWLEFANTILDSKLNSSECKWITQLQDGIPVAVVVYSRFTPFNCEMSIATDGSKKWATRTFLRACCDYPFNQLKMRRVTAIVKVGNVASLKTVQALGYIKEAHLSAWFGDIDGIMFVGKKENCKWL